ncbi:MAG TPA: BtpA/SgcQ family protein [Vicinamibacteria bacterium]|jgi:membrane complex biogenesis BtpA family protein
MARFRELFRAGKTLIGVIHLPPLPGYPSSPGMAKIIEKALRDLEALEAGPLHGALVENEEDRPHRVEASRETIAAMTLVTRELVAAARKTIIGVEILLNDPEASLAAAAMTGAAFIRTDYFVDPMERPEHGGAMRIDPEGLLRYRRSLGADSILILADLQVKYARMLVERSLAESARLAREAGADAVVVTGTRTGEPPSIAEIAEARRGAGGIPVLVGSGLSSSNAAALLAEADGALVGTSLKRGEGIDPTKVKELLSEASR